MVTQKFTLGITPGSLLGVGPELMIRALYDYNNHDVNFIWCGDFDSLIFAAKRAQLKVKKISHDKAIINNEKYLVFMPNYESHLPKAAMFLKNAVNLAKQNIIDGIVTGPVDKACLLSLDDNAGYAGQTEYLGKHLGRGRKVMMSFVGGPFILSLYSTHVPLIKVASLLSIDGLTEHIRSLAYYAGKILVKAKKSVRITVLGLNPHAGEEGLLGREEMDIIVPALIKLKEQKYKVLGPVSADGFFAYFHKEARQPDVVLALYHDQGLAPYKLLAKGEAVNLTMGLAVVRTSPAHGTAPKLVGKNKASSLSCYRAIDIAAKRLSKKC